MKSSYMKIVPLVATIGLGGCTGLEMKSSDQDAKHFASKLGADPSKVDCDFIKGQSDAVKCNAIQDECKIQISCIHQAGMSALDTWSECKIENIEGNGASCPKANAEFKKEQEEQKHKDAKVAGYKKLNEYEKKTGNIMGVCKDTINEKKELVGMTCLAVREDVKNICKTAKCSIGKEEVCCVVTDGLPDSLGTEDYAITPKEACEMMWKLREEKK